jgi:hypothetical protein
MDTKNVGWLVLLVWAGPAGDDGGSAAAAKTTIFPPFSPQLFSTPFLTTNLPAISHHKSSRHQSPAAALRAAYHRP